MRFTTPLERANFIRTALFAMSPVDAVQVLASTLAHRISLRVKGRMWMAAHMRRKDCASSYLSNDLCLHTRTVLQIGWTSEYMPQSHLQRIKKRLETGVKTLRTILHNQKVEALEVTGVVADKAFLGLNPPQSGDP